MKLVSQRKTLTRWAEVKGMEAAKLLDPLFLRLPVEPKALAMPGDDSFGFDDDQDIAPPAPEFGQDYP